MDLRKPIGLLFTIFGAILLVFSFVSTPNVDSTLLGLSINLVWGIVLLIFGIAMGGAALSSKGQ